MLKKRWQQIKQQILFRRVPHAILSWRYLLPRQNRAVVLHKQAFKQAWPRLPRPVWWGIAIYSYSLWYLWYGWQQIFRVWRKMRPRQTNPIPLSAGRQLLELLWLAFGHAIPPYFYYSYQLYRFPEKQWLDFIYTHELPHWHLALSPKVTEQEIRLISDKQLFAQTMSDMGLPAIDTIACLTQGEMLQESALWQQRSLFIKPVCGSRKEGCHELIYHPEQDSYQLRGATASDDRQQIVQRLQIQLDSQSLLIQPLLRNHQAIAPYCPDGQLTTIRLVTVIQPDGIEPLCAMLEIPIKVEEKVVLLFPISIDSGEMLNSRTSYKYLNDELQQCADQLPGQCIIDWKTVVRTAQQAHASFPNIRTIGWDLAVTENGVVLIEGNFNWGVDGHQIGGCPLLNKELCSTLGKKITHIGKFISTP